MPVRAATRRSRRFSAVYRLSQLTAARFAAERVVVGDQPGRRVEEHHDRVEIAVTLPAGVSRAVAFADGLRRTLAL